MATITVRDLSDEVKTKLRVRAAEHGNSMEAEVREIIGRALSAPRADEGLADGIRRRFAEIGGVELELPARNSLPREPRLP
jgi:plasmid stability protein